MRGGRISHAIASHVDSSTLNAGQEELVICLRTHLRLPLDDLLAVVREIH